MKRVEIDITKEQFSKSKFDKVVNTQFSQLTSPQHAQEEPTVSVEEFFNQYNTLFYDIPQTGENSHTTLIERSSDYIDYNNQSETVRLLLQEINSLQDQINDLTIRNIELQTKTGNS